MASQYEEQKKIIHKPGTFYPTRILHITLYISMRIYK
jgi:hypothetical protein